MKIAPPFYDYRYDLSLNIVLIIGGSHENSIFRDRYLR